jgi:hypothetical protein
LASSSEEGDGDDVVEQWLKSKEKDSEVRKKEGANGRWVVCKLAS